MAQGKRGASREIARQETMNEVLRLRRAGLSINDIARHTGVATNTVRRYIERGLRELKEARLEDTEMLRDLELERLDEIYACLAPRALGDPPDLAYVDRLLRVMELRARILGLLAPPVHLSRHEVNQQINIVVREEA